MITLDEIAFEISNRRLVPFFGAGASFNHLNLNWNMICEKFNEHLSIKETDNLKSAQLFINKYGKNEFSKFLSQFFLINDFDDSLGETYLFLLSLNCHHYFTTNQDNVFEKCLDKYNRNYQIISTTENFSKMIPEKMTIFKFHGDLSSPESIVFSTTDFKKRMPKSKKLSSYNPLDVMFLADTITKGILFLGYSFTDPNIKLFFKHINAIFDNKPPKCYLIEYKPDKSFENFLKKNNIIAIDCTKYFPGIPYEKAYSSTLTYLSNKYFEFINSDDIKSLFDSGESKGIPLKSKHEITNFANYLENTCDSTLQIINKFRGAFDFQNVPKYFSPSVASSAITILKKISTVDEILEFRGLLFNLYLMDIGAVLEIILEYYLKLNEFRLNYNESFEKITLFSVIIHNIPTKYNILYAAMALDKLNSQNINPENLLSFISTCIHSIHDIDEFDENEQIYIKHHFTVAYSKTKQFSNPLNCTINIGSSISFEKIQKQILDSFPKKI